MRSLVILEVEHDEDTDGLQSLVESLRPSTFHVPYRVTILDYAVKVDVPPCFVLDGGVWANEGQRDLDEFFDQIFRS